MEIDKYISELVAHQFPAFYQEDGEMFITFVKAYYEWMEQSGYTINASKSLLEYRDIDATVDQFLSNFKDEFLNKFPAITAANQRFMVKHIKDFYQSKGSNRGMQLLFRLLFDDDIEIYSPGKDILRASDGVWKIPRYLEVEHNSRSKTYINQSITGSKSGATAFVESVHTKVVNQRLIDVINISSLKGNFLYEELVTNDGDLFNAPKVIGSLTAINITDGGANNAIGDIFDVYTSTNGKYGKARVTAVTDGTGRVNFTLVDGGTGYTTASDQVHVSNVNLFTSNRSNSNGTLDYTVYEKVSQDLNSMQWTVSTPSVSNAATLANSSVTAWSGGSVVGNGKIVSVPSSPSNTVIINITNGNLSTATSIGTAANAVLFTGYALTNVSAYGTVTGSNATAVGLHNTYNTFYISGLIRSSANLIANVSSMGTGNGASFSIGALSDTEVVYLFTDFIGGNNVNDIPYMDMNIFGGNSNTGLLLGTQSITCNSATNVVTGIGGTIFDNEITVGSGLYASPGNTYIGTVNSISSNTSLILANVAQVNAVTSVFYYNIHQYGFPKNFSAGYYSYINDALTSAAFTIGTIDSLSAINPGNNYSTNPFVLVRNDYIAGYNRKNIVLEIQNPSGVFAVGDVLSQSISTPTNRVTFNANTGAFTVGEGVTQLYGVSNSYATINSANSTTLILSDIRGAFYGNTLGGGNLVGLASGASANCTGVDNTTTATTVSTGIIVALPNTSIIEIKRSSFNAAFQSGNDVSTSSGGVATVISATQNLDSPAMGNNAIVTDIVVTARGIATELAIMDSGFGHKPGDNIELTTNGNIYAISGTANVYNQGIGIGYWEDSRGMLNSNKYIADGNYYQPYSYEIQSRLSMDKYADILKQLAHVVGTKMYGKVTIGSAKTKQVNPVSTSIEVIIDPIFMRNDNQIVSRDGGRIDARGAI